MQAEGTPARARDGGESDVLAKIGEMPKSDRIMAETVPCDRQDRVPERLADDLVRDARLRHRRQGRLRSSRPRSNSRRATPRSAFSPDAHLDAANMWPTSWALTKLTAADEKKIDAILKKAMR